MPAEFPALLCSGPRRGKQFTYALLEERAPPAGGRGAPSAEEALAGWTLRYFRSHGPAQARDFAWWSGLTLQEAQRGLELAKGGLLRERVDGRDYWRAAGGQGRSRPGSALLLSLYDEYTIAYKDRSALGAERHIERLIAMGNALTSVLVLEGRAAGTWKRVLGRSGVQLTVRPFEKPGRTEKEMIARAAAAYGAFLQMPVSLRFG